MPPTMAIVVGNVLWIPFMPKFHDGYDAIIHIGRLAKMCVINGEDIDAHKLQYFPTTLWGKKQVGLFIMRQQTLLQPREQLFQNLMIYIMRDKP